MMTRREIGLGVLVAVTGCKQPSHHAPVALPELSEGSAGSGMIAQARIGDGDEPADLRFAIDKVYDHQQPGAAAPFHTAGGNWTYVDAHLVDDPAATFGVGMPSLDGSPTDSPSFSGMVLVPTTADAGARFVRVFAKHFHVDAPPPIAGTLAPQKLEVAVLGHNVSSSDSGFSGTGTWDAMKWFFNDGEAEMFFDVSVADRAGMWSEKDPEYDRDVAAALATVLRDGRPPPRTPANDPTLAATGPKLVLGAKIASPHAEPLVKTAARLVFIDDDGTHSTLVAVDAKTGAATELYRTTKRLEDGACEPSGERCVIRETTPSEARNISSSKDKATLLAIDGHAVAPLAIPAFGDNPIVKGLSPDGRFVASGSDGLLVWDRKTSKLHTFDKPAEVVDVAGWRAQAGHELAIVDNRADFDGPHHYVAWDLDANTQAPADAPVTSVAPDGSRRAEITHDGKVIVTPLPSGAARTLVLDPRDRRSSALACCTWIDRRYLWLAGKTPAVIDTDAMKVSLVGAVTGDDRPPVVEPFATRQAIVRGEDGTFLATLVGP